MIEGANILTGSDNLWKYLFTVGTVLLSLSILYPLKQSEIIELNIIELNTDSKKIGIRIKNIKSDQNQFSKYLEFAQAEIDTLSSSGDNDSIYKKVENIQIEIAEERKKLKVKIRNLQLLNTENQGKEDYILKLQEQSKNYKLYFKFGLIFGIVFMVIGLFKWVMATWANDKLRWNELGTTERKTLKVFSRKRSHNLSSRKRPAFGFAGLVLEYGMRSLTFENNYESTRQSLAGY